MKTIFETEVGGDGAKAGVYIQGKQFEAKIGIPVEKILEPAFKIIDSAIDKIEALVPGDQTGLAARLKAEARIEALELLTEQDIVSGSPETEQKGSVPLYQGPEQTK